MGNEKNTKLIEIHLADDVDETKPFTAKDISLITPLKDPLIIYKVLEAAQELTICSLKEKLQEHYEKEKRETDDGK